VTNIKYGLCFQPKSKVFEKAKKKIKINIVDLEMVFKLLCKVWFLRKEDKLDMMKKEG